MLPYKIEWAAQIIRKHLYRQAVWVVNALAIALSLGMYWGLGEAWIVDAGLWMSLWVLAVVWALIVAMERLHRHPKASQFWAAARVFKYPQHCTEFCTRAKWTLLAGGAVRILLPDHLVGIWLVCCVNGTLWAIWGLWLYARLMYWDRR